MKKKTREYIERFHMVTPGDGVLVGLSGGADSVCLLHLLWCLKEEMGITLRALHVHHGLRGAEADRDAEFSGRFCEQLEVPFQIVRIDAAAEAAASGISVEEAGRQARYRILEEEAGRWEAECGCPVAVSYTHLDVYKRQALRTYHKDNKISSAANCCGGNCCSPPPV